MRLALAPSTRVPRPPLWATVVVIAWLAGVGLIELLRFGDSGGPGLCNFKRVTSLPCPTCGGTRAGMALLSGDFLQALLFNPLLILAGVLIAVLLVMRLLFACWPTVTVTRRGWLIITAISLVLVGANWAYLIVYGI